MNKKGNFVILIFFFFLLFLSMLFGVMLIYGSSILNWTFDEVVPEISNLGVIGGSNLTKIAEITIAPVNSFVQSFTWMAGVLYVLMLIGSVAFVLVSRTAPSKWLIGFYFTAGILLIISSIFMSNMYEDTFTGNGQFELILQEHTLLSYLIIFSPHIFTVIFFLVGIVLFSGLQEEGGRF